MDLAQPVIHYGGHWLIPFVIAAFLWREHWLKSGFVIAAVNLIDLDHLLADSIFDPDRCSISIHLLHGWEAALTYILMLAVPKWWVRAFGIGAIWHLAIDGMDCAFQSALA